MDHRHIATVGLKSNERIKSKHTFINLSRPFISDQTTTNQHVVSIKRRVIRAVDRDGRVIERRKSIFVFFKTGSSRRRTRSRSNPNSPCILHEIASRLFESTLDSFPRRLNAQEYLSKIPNSPWIRPLITIILINYFY